MNKIKIFLILIVLFISISAVSAEGNFTSLQNEIDASDNSIDIQQDYKYDSTSDNGLESGILINKSDFTINGNGYTIDGANQARIFNIIGPGVTILNLNLINGNSDNGGAISNKNGITLNNVSFINNNATEGGSIYSTAQSTIENCYFDNNTAKYGGGIFSFFSEAYVTNSTFTNSKSNYGPAIFTDFCTCVFVQDCIFKNLNAEESGGAIGIAHLSRMADITNCTFINTSSRKNGGSICIFGMVGEGSIPMIEISDSKFFNSTGDYGGALSILSGGIYTPSSPLLNKSLCFAPFDLNNCEFYNNTASYDGGAAYISGVDANINNVRFYGNKLQYNDSHGGGLYSEFANTTIENSEFINNTKQGIYAYDNGYTKHGIYETDNQLTVKDTTFANNGEAIHAVFTDCNLTNITVENDILILNETSYLSNVHEIGKSISFTNNTINVETLPSRYDSRDWGWVSSVKDQGIMGSCWAFGTCGALESSLLKATGIEYDLSENNMQDIMLQFTKYGRIGAIEGGIMEQGLEYILSWFGVMSSEYDTYDELGRLSPLIIADNEKIHIVDAIIVEPRKNSTDNDALKKAILRCGSVVAAFNNDVPETGYNENTSAYYQNSTKETSHEISLVGWDDNFPAPNFKTTPPGDGAFIIKNSHGTDEGEKGFNYISYYDTSLLSINIGIGFIIENTENYTTNYQTDLSGVQETITNNGSILSYKNTYESEYGPESISAVGTYFKADENYTLEIYVNDELMHAQSGISPFTGYHTVKLTKEIPITKGDNFTALMKKASVMMFDMSRNHYQENMTFIDLGDGWKDLALENKTISLKVYTKDLAIFTEDLVKIYKNASQFEAKVGAPKQVVSFEINGGTYTRTSNAEGIAKMNINLNPGNYTIKTTFNGTTVENTITVLPTLIANNLVKYFRNASQFLIELIDGQGNPLSGQTITMNINGVFYDRTTNASGIAKLNINLNPGEYILTAIDPITGLQMAYTITVLPTLTAEDLNMTYLDGSQFEAKLIDGQGKALSGVKITFNINGVFYDRTTDANGTAKLNIRLMAGEYIITSQYGDATIANTIRITA
ncbi:MAG: hypothetical protein IJH63_02840 [Methanobrevibacter sp.]|nr:hypothetical protein [Methanobrevibacter sp.]